MVVALALFERTGNPTYLQLHRPDPPDAYLMWESKESKGQLGITTLEVTTFFTGRSGEEFIDQIARTKIPGGIPKLTNKDVLAVWLSMDAEVDFEHAKKKLNDNPLVKFPVWTIRDTGNLVDTTAELTIVNPAISQREINIGEAAHAFKALGEPNTKVVNWVENPEEVRVGPGEPILDPPWDTIGKT
jgi:hypothetical protein